MKLKFLIFNFSFLILTACGASKPVATTHTERIEERVMPIPVGTDTIEITLCRDTRSECPDGTRSVNQRSLSLWRKNSVHSVGFVRNNNSVRENPTSTASSNLCKSDERLLTKSKQRIKKELKNQSDLCNLWETAHSEGVNSVRIKSTRGVNISRLETDTTSTLRITLRPDTVFVPYINHIRSDTIVVPDRVCQQKLNRSNMTNLFLILILIIIFIFLFKQKYKSYR